MFAEKPSDLPAGLDLDVSGPTIAVRTNPSDPYSKVLVIAGSESDQLVTAARAIALQNAMLQGRTVHVSDFELPAPREADDAPLWLKTDRASPFWNYTDNAELRSDGSGPLAVYLRVPPDLYYGDRSTIPLVVDYRYNAIPLANGSTLRVTANGTLVNELPLPHADNPKKVLSYTAAVPLTGMRPFTNTLLFNFYFQIAKTGHCQDTPPINLQGAILRSSHLDLNRAGTLGGDAQSRAVFECGIPFHPVRGSLTDDGGVASDAVGKGDRRLPDAPGLLRRADGISRASRGRGKLGGAGKRFGLPGDRNGSGPTGV